MKNDKLHLHNYQENDTKFFTILWKSFKQSYQLLREYNFNFENDLFDNKKHDDKKLSRRKSKYIVNNYVFLKFFDYYWDNYLIS